MKTEDLKASLLQYAIQGKLVPQNPDDEPAPILLERIREKKQELIHSGKIKKDKNDSRIYLRDGKWIENNNLGINEIEVPFNLPNNWTWCRISSIFSIINGDRGKNYPSKSKLSNIGIPFISAINLGENGIIQDENLLCLSEEQYNSLGNGKLIRGDHLVCIRGSLGKHTLFNLEMGAIASSLTILRPIDSQLLHPQYVEYYLSSPLFVEIIDQYENGSVQPNLSAADLAKFLFPLPPIVEQKRIISKLEELQPLIDTYARNEEQLSQLNSALASSLRKSILQYAIQGRLVPQDPNDEPASVLLERIRGEKQRLVREGKIKKDKNESRIYRKDGKWFEQIGKEEKEIAVPYVVPESWGYSRVGSICSYLHRGKSPKYSEVKQYPVVAQKCNQWSGLEMDRCLFIDPETLSKYDPVSYLQTGDILINSTGTGTCGRAGVYDSSLNQYELAVADSHVTVVRALIESGYLYLYFAGPDFQRSVEDISNGSTNQIELATTTIYSLLLPVPPLAEQKRIVAKLKECLKQVGKLEN